MIEGVDPKKFSVHFCHSDTHNISYTIYKGKTTLLSEFNRARHKDTYRNAACFGSLLLYMRKSGKYNVKYDVIRDPKARIGSPRWPVLEPIEVKKWFQITRKAHLLPKSVRFFSKNSSQYIVLNMKEWPLSLSYMFLVVFRYLREDTGLIRAFVHLVDEVGVDPYAAFVAVHRWCTNMTGHSALPKVRNYLEGASGNASFDLALARKVRKFVNDPWKYDERDVEDPRYSYSLHKTIDSVPTGIKGVDRDMNVAPAPLSKITHPKITPFVYEEDSDVAKKLYEEIIND